MKFKMLTLPVLIAASAVAPGAWADYITLNPSANNNGLGTLDSTTTSFQTSNAQTSYGSVLDILGTGTGTTPNYTESGYLQITSFNPEPLSTTNVTSNYNVYATFKAQGGGIWLSDTNYAATSFTSFVVDVYGSPGCANTGVNPCTTSPSGLTFVTPTTGNATTLAQYGISSQGSGDFLLGTAAVDPTALNTAFASIASGTSGSASSSVNAVLNFTPAANTSGVDGFWSAPIPFIIDIGAGAIGNPINTSFTRGSTVRITTATVGGVPQGTGNLNFTTVPEPASLALLGIGMLGMGSTLRRRKA
jgi:hypothetical protein